MEAQEMTAQQSARHQTHSGFGSPIFAAAIVVATIIVSVVIVAAIYFAGHSNASTTTPVHQAAPEIRLPGAPANFPLHRSVVE
jgi:archaellin